MYFPFQLEIFYDSHFNKQFLKDIYIYIRKVIMKNDFFNNLLLYIYLENII